MMGFVGILKRGVGRQVKPLRAPLAAQKLQSGQQLTMARVLRNRSVLLFR
jgi:hypothetical protein